MEEGAGEVVGMSSNLEMAPVVFGDLNTASDKKFGVATLNAESSLNALSLPMVRLLLGKLKEWLADDAIVGVVLKGAGSKAFCAGGDIRELYHSIIRMREDEVENEIRINETRVNEYAEEFFRHEYELDLLIHTYPKPVICWGSGIVMGGGIGLMAGASHRIVTETSRLAMPEVSIGFYPDVGGTYVLPSMPYRIGLFLALTGAQINGADAMFSGLATHFIASNYQELLFSRLSEYESEMCAFSYVDEVLGSLSVSADTVSSHISASLDDLTALLAGAPDELTAVELHRRFSAYNASSSSDNGSSEWIRKGIASALAGSPTSFAICLEIWKSRVRNPVSIETAFKEELEISRNFCRHKDFPEGVRALLIDKDRKPRWSPEHIQDVDRKIVEAHFV